METSMSHEDFAAKLEKLYEQHITILIKLENLPKLAEDVTDLRNDMRIMKANWLSIKDLVEAQALVKTTGKYLRVIGGWAAAVVAIVLAIKNIITGNWPVQ